MVSMLKLLKYSHVENVVITKITVRPLTICIM